MIEFELTDEQKSLKSMVARLADDRYKPHAIEWDENRTPLPHEERRRLADLGLVGIALPEEYGGGGGSLLDALIVIEELAKRSQVPAFSVFEAATGPARVIDLFGDEAARSRFLPHIAAGEKTMAVAISEPDAGSAATDATTSARLEGDEYIINGTKRWCSGAGHAEQYLVYARLTKEAGSRGIGALVVDLGSPGLTFGPPEKLMGFRGIPSADMYFDNVRVPKENLIIGAGGFNRLFAAFSIERLGNSTMCLAIGQTCLDRCAAYVQSRQQFGKPVVEFQMVQGAIADMVIQIEAARLLIYRAAAKAGRGAPLALEASVAKAFANDMARRVSEQAIQLHGGYGYSVEYEIERLHREAQGWALGGGTSNIQRLRIASEYLGRRFDQRA